MIKCIAIDDEPLALQQLTNYLKKVPFFEIAGSCLSASEAMKILSEEPVDAIFLDINMPDLNGLEFVQSLVHQRSLCSPPPIRNMRLRLQDECR